MSHAKVVLKRVHRYDEGEIRSSVAEAIAAIGSLRALVRPGAKVFVKVNHLSPPSPPERGIITHPAFTGAVLSVLKEVTPHITVGDDLHPSSPDGFEVSGYRKMCARLGIRLINLREIGFKRVEITGKVLNEVYLAQALLEADVIVNLPKLKTHSLTLLTGAVKNLYGAIPGGLRTAYHGQYKDPTEFNQVLVDIFAAARPHLTIMDGIVAMEGAGPANGVPREVGVILASQDGVAVDAVAARIIGLDPLAVPTIRCAHERGVGRGVMSEIEIVRDQLPHVSPFRLPPLPVGEIVGRAPRFLTRFLTGQLSARPQVVRRSCVGCGACARICPTGAATVAKGKARIDRRTCIRCMCCHEACRFDAIALQRSALGHLLRPFAHRQRRARHRARG